MTRLSEVFTQLRRNNRKQYALLFGCLFFSTLLITAYCIMMRSPTVLNVLPEGGDSRKQVMMVFVLAVIGCAAFCLYAAGLFFREKSRETGIFLALGASKSVVGCQLKREVGIISQLACVAGMILGTPLAMLIWKIFRMTIVDSSDMLLTFDYRAYGIALAFSVFVVAALMVMLSRSINRTNIIDIVSESHKAEPIRAVPRWYGWGGVLILFFGVLLGYLTPSFCVIDLHWYPPEWLTGIVYIPAFIGLYMLLLHTVVNGWKRGESRYKHIVATGMMQFQGRQTVRNMLVITVLVAGAYFSAFYVPLMMVPAQMSYDERPMDYAFTTRCDQPLIERDEIDALAAENGVKIKDYVTAQKAVLGIDGDEHVESQGAIGITYTAEHRDLLASDRFFSESAYNALTGDSLDLAPGEIAGIFDSTGGGYMSNDVSLVTNPITGESLPVTPREEVLKNDLLFGCRVLDDADYEKLTQGLPETWLETQTLFNADGADSYDFAKALFNKIVDSSGGEVALCSGYDNVVKARCNERGETYFFDEPEKNGIPEMSYDERNSSNFRLNWMYMPQFRVLDKADFVTSMAVFLLLFVFVSILCFSAVAVILYTRCMTIAITNAWVYDDLRHLGAPNAYLRGVARGQISRVFKAPIITGTLLILAFVCMILMFNGATGISAYEAGALRVCLVVVAVISCFIYALYRLTLHSTCKKLDI